MFSRKRSREQTDAPHADLIFGRVVGKQDHIKAAHQAHPERGDRKQRGVVPVPAGIAGGQKIEERGVGQNDREDNARDQ